MASLARWPSVSVPIRGQSMTASPVFRSLPGSGPAGSGEGRRCWKGPTYRRGPPASSLWLSKPAGFRGSDPQWVRSGPNTAWPLASSTCGSFHTNFVAHSIWLRSWTWLAPSLPLACPRSSPFPTSSEHSTPWSFVWWRWSWWERICAGRSTPLSLVAPS